jgi:hypothetical protein
MPSPMTARSARTSALLAALVAVMCDAGEATAQCSVDIIAGYVKEEQQKVPPEATKARIKAVVARCNKLSALTSCTLQYAIKRIEIGDSVEAIREECMK